MNTRHGIMNDSTDFEQIFFVSLIGSLNSLYLQLSVAGQRLPLPLLWIFFLQSTAVLNMPQMKRGKVRVTHFRVVIICGGFE